jgi:hypothetical protein
MITSSQVMLQKYTSESMLLIATLYTSLNFQDNIADIASLIRQKKVKCGLKASQIASGTPMTSANVSQRKLH